MNRMNDSQRNEVARILDQVRTEDEDGYQLDAALDAIAETVLPETIERYFEAHITTDPHEEHTFEEFASMCTEFGWRASMFEHDDVDQIAGKWFASFRSTSHTAIVSEVRGMVYSLGQADTEVLRYKIEETLLDSKCGDKL